MRRRRNKDVAHTPTILERIGAALFSALAALLVGGVLWGVFLVWYSDAANSLPHFAPVVAIALIAAIFGFMLNGNVVGIIFAGIIEGIVALLGRGKA